MRLTKIPLQKTNAFTSFFLDYLAGAEGLKNFYGELPSIENFKKQIEQKKHFSKHHRTLLVQQLQQQYSSLEIDDLVKNNIQSLENPNTFTITTGHQLNIFTGPLYFIYKIITVINCCKALKNQYPDCNFVPVYWMASEDHDFDEISYFKLFGKKYQWSTTQKGAVGRFDPKELKSLIEEVPGDTSLFKSAYLRHNTLSEAVRCYVNELFGEHGLVVIDGDNHELKKIFSHVIADDLHNGTAKKLVEQTNTKLEAAGYKTQVFARDINFFYLDSHLRSRLEKMSGRFHVVDTELSFSSHEIDELIKTSPEKFSPNVILRPLYQEVILPNLAYAGGPAEVVYWLQLKAVFDHYQVPFPVLLPRNFAMVVDEPTSRKIEKTGIVLEDLFLEKNYLFNHLTIKQSRDQITLNGKKQEIENQFAAIKQQAEALDKTLGPFVGAETKRAIRSLEKIESKLLRAAKRLQADRLRQVESIKDTLFPGGSLQERSDNFLNFYLQDREFIHQLIENFDPFDFRFNVLSY